MKTKILLLLISILFIVPDLSAQFFAGGEITWKCLPNGNFRFQAKLYRECYNDNGHPVMTFGSMINMTTNAPGFSTIVLKKDTVLDLSPDCSCSTNQYYCTSTNVGVPGSKGAVEAHVFSSDLDYPNGIALTGTPPASGWHFSYASCCRRYTTNLPNNLSFCVRSIMYPYKNTAVDSCFDSSPEFYQDPVTSICSSTADPISHMAKDAEFDKLTYSFSELYTSVNNPTTMYTAGYSYDKPFPDTAMIDPNTGLLSFASPMLQAAYSVYGVKCESWRDGEKIAEVQREYNLAIVSCGSNSAPNLTLTSSTNPNLNTGYVDTVSLNDTVIIDISVTDFDFCSGGSAQNIYFEAYSQYFDTAFSLGMITNGATLTPSPTPNAPLSGQFGLASQFRWVVGHIQDAYNCDYYPFTFTFKAYDNECPQSSSITKSITLWLEPAPGLDPVDTLKIASNSPSSILLSWPKVIDSLGKFDSYELWMDQTNGPNDQLVFQSGNPNDTSFLYTLPNMQDSLIFTLIIKDICNSFTQNNPANTYAYDLISIEELIKDKFNMFPNPVNNNLQLTAPKEHQGKDAVIQLFNHLGQNVLTVNTELSVYGTDIDMSGLRSGTYFVKIVVDQKIILNRVITKM